MPRARGKRTVSCQTDTVFLSEEQVENIITKSISSLREEVSRLQNEIKDLQSTSNSSSLTKDNNDALSNVQSDLSDLKSTTEKLTKDNDALNNLQQVAEVQLEQLEERLDNFEENNSDVIQKVHRKIEAKEGLINKMEEKTDQLEQIHKMNNIRIASLVEEEDEDVQVKVINLAKRMKLTIQPADIKDARRMGPKKGNKTRDVLVILTSKRLRDDLYQRRKMLTSATDPVYVNEDLTQRRSQLFYEGRKLRKQGRIYGIWTQQGNILIKVSQQSQPKEVTNYKDIIVHIEKQSNSIPANTVRGLETSSSGGSDFGDPDYDEV